MKIFSLILLLSLIWPIASYSLPLTESIKLWLVKPKPLAPWKFVSNNHEYSLTAQSKQLGGGAIFYRPAANACVISVPHKFYDTHTLEIGQQLYKQHCQLLVTNSHHRFSDSDDNEAMDYSKRLHSLHNSAISSFQLLNPKAKVFQLHGFSSKKRKTETGKKADFIVSQGLGGDHNKQILARCLSNLSKHSYYYPEQVRELGGTKNIVHSIGLVPFSFIHIEISKTMRDRLVSEPKLMSQFSVCLSQVI